MITFLNLRNNHLIYILKTDSIPTLEIGKVVNTTVPIPRYGKSSMYNDLVLDVTVDIDGKPVNFLKVTASTDVADFGNLIITTSKEAMSSEISSLKEKSVNVLDSIELHKSIINGCDEILKELNPEIAEKQRQEEENKALREEINSLKEMFSEFMNLFKN